MNIISARAAPLRSTANQIGSITSDNMLFVEALGLLLLIQHQIWPLYRSASVKTLAQLVDVNVILVVVAQF